MKLLEIKNLTTEFKTGQGIVKAVRNVNYSLEKGEILGIVGESGSGKSPLLNVEGAFHTSTADRIFNMSDGVLKELGVSSH